MTTDEIIARLKREPNLKRISDDTDIPYATLYRWHSGETEKPGAHGIDKLRVYFLSQDIQRCRPQ